jgi:pyruvate dehydrogenase E1 component
MLQRDIDPQETREWLEAFEAVVDHDGLDRAQHLLERVVGHAQLTGAAPAAAGTTPYINTIPPQHEPEYPVDEELERRVRSLMRAIAMVLKANEESSELGGHR